MLGWLSDAAQALNTTFHGASNALTVQCTSLNHDEPSIAHLAPVHSLALAPSGIGITFVSDLDGSIRVQSLRAGAERFGVRRLSLHLAGRTRLENLRGQAT